MKLPGGPVVRTLCVTAGGTGLILGQGTKISYVVWAWPKKKTKKKKGKTGKSGHCQNKEN